MTSSKDWWTKPLRIIQPNMQVKDTAHIDPQKLMDQIADMGANAIVFNTGGIYAWYNSSIPFHTVNDHLPKHTDLLQDLIQACHERDIRFIARFDFSKADDSVYLRRPGWFVRKEEGRPDIIGATRPGAWPLLMSTCMNSGYRNADVAAPVLQEVLSRYEIDGIFFNAPGYVFCTCENCQRKYMKLYGKELPRASQELEKDFSARCFDDNMEAMYKLIKQTREEVPMILYYNLHRDNLQKRVELTDMLCTEPQDVLSLGHTRIPEFWQPALSIKVGQSVPGRPHPFGIVHSCPGMDWRHTGLPTAEYRFWLAQIPANGGQIWHSLTGIPDTIADKRILETVTELNNNAAKLDTYMDKALPLAQVALLWNAGRSAEGLAEALINKQIPFAVLLPESAAHWELDQYKAVMLPADTKYSASFIQALQAYAAGGGCIIAEGRLPSAIDDTEWSGALQQLHQLFGIREETTESEYLTASYLRFHGNPNPLQAGMENTALIAHRGKVAYCEPLEEQVRILATLVPPFSPMESVGAPPERASLAVTETDLPLAIEHSYGAGRILYFPFSLSELISEFKLAEHEQLLANAVHYALDGKPIVAVTSYQGLQVTVFSSEGDLLVHLVNGAGRRPLSTTLPLHQIEVKLRPETGIPSNKVELLIGGGTLEGDVDDGVLTFTLPQLEVWECIRIPLLSSKSST